MSVTKINKIKVMKKIYSVLIGILLMGGVITSSAERIGLRGKIDPTGSTTGHTKSPIRPWYIDLTDNVITMSSTPCDYTLNLYDEDGEVVYSAFVPAGTTQVVLPTTLTGSFELLFETDTYYYYGYIEL